MNPPDSCPCFVLVVDDDPSVLTSLVRALRLRGFAVLTATTGTQAVQLYRRYRRAISVVLVDVQMPDLDGPQTLAALRQIDPDLRCCFMSGDVTLTEAERVAMGAAHVFDKPCPDLDELAFMLGQVARNRR
jgi:DNA-binding NtrC family response regulator